VEAALHFVETGGQIGVESLGEGNINDTYLIRCQGRSFVLQRINSHVFPRPELVVANARVVTTHLEKRARIEHVDWGNIRVFPTTSGEPFYKDSHGDVWRAQSYIDGTETFSGIDTPGRARQVGMTLGRFHRLLADLPVSSLHDTLPGFHVLSSYLAHFDRVRDATRIPDSPRLRYCLEMVAEHRGGMDRLRLAEEKGLLIPRIIHGDPKVDNILFDAQTGEAVCLIDLDTVRPGLVHYDIGDCLRSCCNRAGEKGDDAVSFDTDLAHQILVGYYAGAQDLITGRDKEYIHSAVCLLSFELGLRFLTDYVEGNRYFKIVNKDDNLLRACRQFQLLRFLIEMGDVFRVS